MNSHFVGYFDAVSSDYLSQRIEMSAQILVKGLLFCVLVKFAINRYVIDKIAWSIGVLMLTASAMQINRLANFLPH